VGRERLRHASNSRAARQQLEGVRRDAAAKRALDLIVASAMLVVALPIVLCVALAIVVDSRGGVFYRCPRVGRNGRPMWMLKFRKMHRDASGAPLTVADDQRFTRTGRVLARTKLDEVPQLWNVLRGEMSLVGPRPEDSGFVERFRDEYAEILVVKPGITGLSQLAFAKESEIIDADNPVEDYLSRLLPQKVALDRFYAQHRSLLMDVKIICWTGVAVILRRNVAVHRSSGALSLRRRPNAYVDAGEPRVA
jgi:lipopolysaccharide/colanic/teichoic acid biosynthesis glycosyltransferase